MNRMVIDDLMWEKLSQLIPKPKGRHGKDDRLFYRSGMLDNTDRGAMERFAKALWTLKKCLQLV